MEKDLLEYFDNYFFDKLNNEEKQKFEKRLSEDEEFNNEFKEYLAIVEAINHVQYKKLKQRFVEIRDEQDKSFLKLKYLRITIAAAAMLVILFIPSFLIYQNITKNTRIYKKYYIEDSGIPVFMGDKHNVLLNEAMIEFKDKNYKKALEILKSIENLKPKNDTINFYIGLCYLNIENIEFSSIYLQKITDTTSNFYYASKYYLSLAMIKERDIINARKNILEVMKCKNCYYKEKAENLLKEIE